LASADQSCLRQLLAGRQSDMSDLRWGGQYYPLGLLTCPFLVLEDIRITSTFDQNGTRSRGIDIAFQRRSYENKA
jgi:hypothetical protein